MTADDHAPRIETIQIDKSKIRGPRREDRPAREEGAEPNHMPAFLKDD